MNFIHPTALVERAPYDGIGDRVKIWAFASITLGASIGDDSVIGQGVHIGPKVVVGNRCKIQNGAQLFEGVTLEDDVFIGPGVVFTNVLTPRAFINRKTEFKPTLVKRGASIGANATILCGITIGEYAMVGAGAVVTRDVTPHRLVVGNPARISQYVCKCGLPILNPDSFVAKDASWYRRTLDCSCRVCGEKYSYEDYKLVIGAVAKKGSTDAESTSAP